MTAAFVNSDTSPLNVKVKGYLVKSYIDSEQHREVISLEAVREYTYPHPDAPENATVTVIRVEGVKRYTSSDPEWPALALLNNAQKNAGSILAQMMNFVA